MSATCKSCGAEIIWALTENGKRIPLDAEPIAPTPGRFLLSNDDPPVATAITIAKTPLRQYVSHFATCPNADSHRKS